MPYECKTDLEDIDGERYYYLYTYQGYIVYHWDRETRSLEKISSNFFIKLDNARACAREHVKNPRRGESARERLMADIERLQEELRRLDANV